MITEHTILHFSIVRTRPIFKIMLKLAYFLPFFIPVAQTKSEIQYLFYLVLFCLITDSYYLYLMHNNLS